MSSTNVVDHLTPPPVPISTFHPSAVRMGGAMISHCTVGQAIIQLLSQKKIGAAVDRSEIRPSPAEVGSLSHYLQGFIHPSWLFGIFFFIVALPPIIMEVKNACPPPMANNSMKPTWPLQIGRNQKAGNLVRLVRKPIKKMPRLNGKDGLSCLHSLSTVITHQRMYQLQKSHPP